jgi:Hemerythrin HHE cation binding domain
MLQVQPRPQSRRLKDDLLAQAIERLEHTMEAEVPGHEYQWATETGAALTGLDAVLRKHAVMAEAPDGLFSEIDLNRPTLSRQVGKLEREHKDFLERVRDLRTQVQSAATIFQSPRPQVSSSGSLPAPASTAGVADFGALRQQLAKFLGALREHHDCENALVIESVTTDLGAGD